MSQHFDRGELVEVETEEYEVVEGDVLDLTDDGAMVVVSWVRGSY